MKKICLLFIISLFFNPALANKSEERRTLCKNLSQAGGVIMEQRQAGASMSKVVESININEVSDRIMERITIAAYKKENHTSPQEKSKAIKDFKDEVYMMCLDNF